MSRDSRRSKKNYSFYTQRPIIVNSPEGSYDATRMRKSYGSHRIANPNESSLQVLAVSPDLGDIYGGAKLTISVSSPISSLTIDGVECTNLTRIGPTTFTCIAPPLEAGTYTISAIGPAGTGILQSAYESWHPTVDYPAARVFQSDQEISSSSTNTVRRFGILSSTVPTVFSVSENSYVPLDGIGFVQLSNGRLLLLGGAPQGHASERVNTIWYSDDSGLTWNILLENSAGSSTRPAPAHTFGCFTMTISGVEYVYWVGGDPFAPTGNVFRSSNGGQDWVRISTSCPTSGLALYMYGVLNNNIYVIGGQVDINDGAASKKVYVSTDYGITWSDTGLDAPADVWGTQLGPLPVKDNKLWVCGSGRYDSIVNDFSNGVFTFDGSAWVEVLANGHSQFPKSRYHSAVSFNDVLWRFNGSTWDGVTLSSDTRSAHYSSDGITWNEWLFPLPWGNTHAQSALVTNDGILLTEGFQSTRLYIVREHTGPTVSLWRDRGSSRLSLFQSTSSLMPVLDSSGFGGIPGIVTALSQVLSLSSPDRSISTGNYEAWIIGKTDCFDESAANASNPPNTVVGSINGSSWNNFGFYSGTLQYNQFDSGWQISQGGLNFNDNSTRLYGVQHSSSQIKLWVDSVQQGDTDTSNVTLDTSWTGWDAIGCGYNYTDFSSFVNGAVVVIKGESSFSNSTFLTKLEKWSKKWDGSGQLTNNPIIYSVSPSNGTISGGTSVTITGKNFTGVTGLSGVKFGTSNAQSYTVNSDTRITATTAEHVESTVNILVTHPSNGRSIGGKNAYTYSAAFDPTTIPGMTLWLDATDLTQGGGIVTAINNKAGGTDPTINASEEPTYTANNASYNNRPSWKCVAGAGSAKVIRASTAAHGLTNGAFTVVFVGQCGNSNYMLGAPTGGTVIAGGGGSGDKWQMSSDAANYLVSAGGLAENPSVVICVFNGASSKIYVNSVTPSTGNAGSLDDLTALSLFIGNYGAPADALGANGDTTHFLVYTGALDQSSCAYLANGFGEQSGIIIS